MNRSTRALLLLALVVPVAAYVAGSLAAAPDPGPADRGPVILREAPTPPPRTSPARTSTARTSAPRAPSRRPPQGEERQDEARVVTPPPTPVGEDDDEWDNDEWDDDERDDDDTTDDSRDEGDD